MFNIWIEYNLPFRYSLICYWKDFWNCISLCLPPCSCKHTVKLSFAKLYLAMKTNFMSQKIQDFLKTLLSSIFSVWKSYSLNLTWQCKNAAGVIIYGNWTNGTISNTGVLSLFPKKFELPVLWKPLLGLLLMPLICGQTKEPPLPQQF